MADYDWDLEILDAAPPADALVALGVGDVDADGRAEVVIGGEDAILWYRPSTHERGVVDSNAKTMVGLELVDIDGDGRDEVVSGVQDESSDTWTLSWFDPGSGLDGDWTRHVIDPECVGSPHDIRYTDLDGDGVRELVANAAYTTRPGVFAYSPPDDPTERWERHPVTTGRFSEGMAVGDVDGDGRIEVVHGPDVFSQPDGGAFAGEWDGTVYAPSLRSFCRTALVDITGDGLLDIVVSESEYPDCRVCWFENRGVDGWRAHELDRGLYNVHSLSAWRDGDEVYVYAAEMAEGGWGGHYRWSAEQFLFRSDDGGEDWSQEVLTRGAGTHEAAPVAIDGDLAFVGKEANHPVVHLLRRSTGPSSIHGFAHRLLDRDKPSASTDILTADVDGDGRPEVVTGRWWYHAPDWQRFEIPGVSQVHCVADLDGDGRVELIGTAPDDDGPPESLTSDLVLLRPTDPAVGEWERHRVGNGSGDWIQGSGVVPLGEDGSFAFVATYHDTEVSPEVFEVPSDPTDAWPSRPIADVPSGQDLSVEDITGNGHPDVLTGKYLVENLGTGEFESHRILPEDFSPARFGVGDLTGDGRPNLVVGEDTEPFEATTAQRSRLDGFESNDLRLQGPRPSTDEVPLSRLAWFDPPADPREEWTMHVVDQLRRPRSVGVADLDDDGVPEILAGEHDSSWRYRSQSRLFAYERSEPDANAWVRRLIEDRFEHNAGAKVVCLDGSTPAVLSHGWSDSKYVHLWEVPDDV